MAFAPIFVDAWIFSNYDVTPCPPSSRDLALKVKLVPIGNSKGVRLPRAFIKTCGFGEEIDMRLDDDRIVLAASPRPREGWDTAFETMATAGDDTLLLPDDLASDWDDEEWEW